MYLLVTNPIAGGCTDMNLPSAAPPPEKNHIDVYKLVSDTPGYKFFAICMPMGERPVSAFDDTASGAEQRVAKIMS